MTISPFARWLISTYDWRTAMMVIGMMAWVLLIPAGLFVRRASAAKAVPFPAPALVSAAPAITAMEAFRSPQFIVLALTFFLCCAAHSGPIFHMVSYAIGCGIAPFVAVSIYSLEGLSGLGGRLVFGLLADRFGARPVLITGLLLQAATIACYLFASRLGQFYALSFVFGTVYGGTMPPALRGAGARIFRPTRDGNSVRRPDHGVRRRHVLRAVGEWADLRRL